MSSPEPLDWTSLIGSPQPLEPRLLRLLISIAQLGTPIDDDEPNEHDVVRQLVGEWTLLQLDHLVSHPDQLAYLLVDRFDRRQRAAKERGILVRRIRQLHTLGTLSGTSRYQRSGRSHRSRAEPPRPGPWRRLDDVLAVGSSRGLLHVELTDDGQLAYGVRRRATALLDDHSHEPEVARLLEICGVLHEFFPHADGDWFEQRLDEVAVQVQDLSLQQPGALESDPLSTIFATTFGQQL